MSANCSVCGLAIPDSKHLIAEHKYNGKICYGSYTPVNPVNPFKNLIPEKPHGFVLNTGGSGYQGGWGNNSDNEFIDLSHVANR